ncbi:hypothetical protein PHLGIDRAFT_126456 [Phlebiopsis gigantea 11061_1 CR5-6]|uniref:Uncharacterized protein n=1 Tax=Phlebiopsis gigantea (strain 11061_1 CR5-6) TaxID=745531 RepID=A0A0C3S277_PHLG1|nr:hypothetical protein PHLGIDRAFT_126456 [Phlebiopsis gigantea 11061_1 CR5-6]
MPSIHIVRSLSGGSESLTSRQIHEVPAPRNPDDIPEIGGSPAGFIALVIFLSFIIIFSCVGVFLLLRTSKPDPYERHARRVLSGRHEDTLYEVPLGPPGLKEKVKSWFRFTKKQDGWVRASSGDADEWDASDRLAYDSPAAADKSKSVADFGAATLSKSDTLESVELAAPSLALDAVTLPRLAYADPYTASPTALEPVEWARGGTRSGASGADPAAETPMRVFENGTRFKESV